MGLGSVLHALSQETVEPCAASDGVVLFGIQLIPFVVLLGYLSLGAIDVLSVDGPARDHAPAALQGIVRVQGLPFEDLYEETMVDQEPPVDTGDGTQPPPSGDSGADDDNNQTAGGGGTTSGDNETAAEDTGESVPTPVEINNRAADTIAEDESAQDKVVQVAVTASDQVHLPAQFVGLAIAGAALLVGGTLQTTANSPIVLNGITLPATRQQVAGLILICYFGFMLLAVPFTMGAFRNVDPSKYYSVRGKGGGDVSLSDVRKGEATFTRWYRENAGDRLMPLVYVVTLALIVIVHTL